MHTSKEFSPFCWSEYEKKKKHFCLINEARYFDLELSIFLGFLALLNDFLSRTHHECDFGIHIVFTNIFVLEENYVRFLFFSS